MTTTHKFPPQYSTFQPCTVCTNPGGKAGIVYEGEYIRAGQIDQGQQSLEKSAWGKKRFRHIENKNINVDFLSEIVLYDMRFDLKQIII